MSFSSPVIELIRRRYSCRTYQPRVVASEVRDTLAAFLASHHTSPLGTRGRFALVAATSDDRATLKGLGTYGFIKNAPGFIVGAMESSPTVFEDFGYVLELAVLKATDLGLGTCWLGGSFTKGSFAQRIALARGEVMPAVASVGYPAAGSRDRDRLRKWAGSKHRLPGEELFFEGDSGRPISVSAAGPFLEALEAVRWAPSASNRQPWRVVRGGAGWHFYLERTRRYGKGSLIFTVLRLADLQRVDLGIAMCHFELAAHQLGLEGTWLCSEPATWRPGESAEYVASWWPAG